LERYTKNGHRLIDNNIIKNSIRPVGLGWKNYILADIHSLPRFVREGAQQDAMMYSFFGSCELNGVNPWEWLTHVLTALPENKANRLVELLASNYKEES